MPQEEGIIPSELIASKIYVVRRVKVMLDRDLAELYGVETKALKQAVKRNIKRFPDDFMFILSKEEFVNWRSQFVTSKSDKMGLRYAPMAFTEQGIAMLSSVLNSERAIVVNIQIMRTFMRLRQILSTHSDLARKLAELEKKLTERLNVHERAIVHVLGEVRKLMASAESSPESPKRKIGFDVKEKAARYQINRKKTVH
jgi:hypothetical protein